MPLIETPKNALTIQFYDHSIHVRDAEGELRGYVSRYDPDNTGPMWHAIVRHVPHKGYRDGYGLCFPDGEPFADPSAALMHLLSKLAQSMPMPTHAD